MPAPPQLAGPWKRSRAATATASLIFKKTSHAVASLFPGRNATFPRRKSAVGSMASRKHLVKSPLLPISSAVSSAAQEPTPAAVLALVGAGGAQIGINASEPLSLTLAASPVNLYGLSIPNAYLPFAQMCMSYLFTQQIPFADILGLFVGYAHYMLNRNLKPDSAIPPPPPKRSPGARTLGGAAGGGGGAKRRRPQARATTAQKKGGGDECGPEGCPLPQ